MRKHPDRVQQRRLDVFRAAKRAKEFDQIQLTREAAVFLAAAFNHLQKEGRHHE